MDRKKVGALNINSASSILFDKYYKVPSCNNIEYIGEISKIIENEKISMILPVSEPEIRYFSFII